MEIAKLIKRGWELFASRPFFFVGLAIILVIVNIVFGVSWKMPKISYEAGYQIFTWLVTTFLAMGIIQICLDTGEGRIASYKSFFSTYPYFFSYLFVSIIYGVIVVVGFLLLIVPGIYWAIRFAFFGYFVIDQDVGPIEALKGSWRITKGRSWEVLLLYLTSFGIMILGIVTFLGWLIAWPLVSLAWAVAYLTLRPQVTEAIEPVEPKDESITYYH